MKKKNVNLKNLAIVMLFAIFIVPMLFWANTWAAAVSANPEDGAAGVSGDTVATAAEGPAVTGKSMTNTKIAVTFSREMDPSSVEASLTVKIEIPGLGCGTVAGKFGYMGTDAMFIPYSGIIPGLNYTISITRGAEDMAGIPWDLIISAFHRSNLHSLGTSKARKQRML